MTDREGFLSRWARRKSQATRGAPAAPEASADSPMDTPPREAAEVPAEVPAVAGHRPPPDPTAQPAARAAGRPESAGVPPSTPGPAPAASPEPVPTLADVQRLPPGADFSRFARKDVDESVRRAAFKKLFSDPHFNQMDGLDVYIDDYSQPRPIPAAVLRQMVQSRLLGLFQDEDAGQTRPSEDVRTDPLASADGAAGTDVSQSAQDAPPPPGDAPGPAVPHDENPAVQLQPDDAARRAGPEPGAGLG